ncbi:MAG: excinuclease ABC subunit UvrA [Deltaproteobacteria bacterium]|nr:excinuclease ABC subunit UvrA [Deltaproteobacteria bacterium]
MIHIKGAREHNLKNISLCLPRNKLVVITGVSGSGKSSLAFDTLFAEAQRRYLESLSAYSRQFIEQLKKPDVDSIEGLSAPIAIDQKSLSHSPRSTVGTITEVLDYLRLLYAKTGAAFCPQGHGVIQTTSVDTIVQKILTFPTGSKFYILAPIARHKKGLFLKEFEIFQKKGFSKIRINGEFYSLCAKPPLLDKNKFHDVDVLTDQLKVDSSQLNRLSQSLRLTHDISGGRSLIFFSNSGQELLFNTKLCCPECLFSFPKLETRHFSFNSPYGACKLCEGLGEISTVDPRFSDLAPYVEKKLKKNLTPQRRAALDKFLIIQTCAECQGRRIKKEFEFIKICGDSITTITGLTIENAINRVISWKFSGKNFEIGDKVQKEILSRLRFIKNIGLSYLTLDRKSNSLSTGEAQRLRLASQLGESLTGVLYILDEPSIGLHARDHEKLLDSLLSLRDRGNTLIVVEHDEETMRKADHIVDMGLLAGRMGGEIIAQGTCQEIKSCQKSLTGQYLAGKLKIAVPSNKMSTSDWIHLKDVKTRNLKSVSVSFPLGQLISVTGVSGSGKSSLIMETLLPYLKHMLYKSPLPSFSIAADIEGIENIDKVIDVDQSPIGRTPRSNPATYTGLFSPLREYFSLLPLSKMRGYTAGRFSFNVSGGRCEICEGAGLLKIEMSFLPDVYIPCSKCSSKRYNFETLQVTFKDKSIADVLDMSVTEALDLFENYPKLFDKLRLLESVGLGYIKLGQHAQTLSGGEAQRVKLAKELSKRDTGKTLYILDEPTTGLHFEDIKNLLVILRKLVDHGNTVIVIEHELHFIAQTDYIIDLGPEGGQGGGEILYAGPIQEIRKFKEKSYTAQHLFSLLESRK